LGLQKLPGGPHNGPKKLFPKMYDRLSYDYVDDPDYDIFRQILRQHMLETWPLSERISARDTGYDWPFAMMRKPSNESDETLAQII
jgi:hypothetical protein